MLQPLRILAWTCAVASAEVIRELFAYVAESDSNHTAVEPWLLVVIFVPAIVFGCLAIYRKQALVGGVLAILIGLGGLAVLTYIDRTNTMIHYDRWLARGMPEPHEPSQPSGVH